MAYLDAQEAFGLRKLTAIGTAGAINLGIGAALIVGLTVTDFVKQEDNRTKGVFITPEPIEPPPPPPKADPKATDAASVIQVPTPKTNLVKEPTVTVPEGPIVITDFVDPTPTGPVRIIPDPPAPKPPVAKPMFDPVAATPKNNASAWVTPRDYPSRDLREGNEGVSRFLLSIDANGRVSDCRITASSGHAALDAKTCDKVTSRARFNPAKDASGAKTGGNYTGAVRWEIPE